MGEGRGSYRTANGQSVFRRVAAMRSDGVRAAGAGRADRRGGLGGIVVNDRCRHVGCSHPRLLNDERLRIAPAPWFLLQPQLVKAPAAHNSIPHGAPRPVEPRFSKLGAGKFSPQPSAPVQLARLLPRGGLAYTLGVWLL
eukprot:scaffold3092_cov121-Isochrysis_galbana.AAC.4